MRFFVFCIVGGLFFPVRVNTGPMTMHLLQICFGYLVSKEQLILTTEESFIAEMVLDSIMMSLSIMTSYSTMLSSSGFQPGFRGTLEFRQCSTGVPPKVTQIFIRFYLLN